MESTEHARQIDLNKNGKEQNQFVALNKWGKECWGYSCYTWNCGGDLSEHCFEAAPGMSGGGDLRRDDDNFFVFGIGIV